VNELPSSPIREFVDYEELIFTNNPADTAILKSILDAEQIQYFTQNEIISQYYYHALPIRFLVRKDQISEAREIIRDLDLRITSYSTDNLREKKDDED